MQFKILVVDDQTIVAETLAAILVQNGYECRTAYDGEEAFDTVTEFDPHLIISDVLMRKTSGVELYRRLQALPRVPSMILVSGNPAALAEIDLETPPARNLELLTKPVPPPLLLEAVSRMVNALELH